MLRKVRIQNFKSLKDVTLELQKVNLLIGPNNSGKSNFLKGLEFFTKEDKSIYDSTLLFKRNLENILSISFYIENYNKKSLIKLEGTSDKFGLFLSEEININLPDKNLEDTLVKNGHDSISSYVEESNIYKPDPNTFTKLADLNSADKLLPNCSNLVPFLFNLGQNHKKLFKTLEDNLAKCIEDLVSIGTPAEGNKLRLKLFDKEDNDYWADEVSEGVLYFLALLCIIHQPNPPKLLLLEEPEKGIHPRRIHEIMKFIFQLVEDKDIQVIMTSHNEHVLEEFTTMPESVFIFDKDEEGATFVKNLQKDIIEPSIVKAKEFGIEPINYTDNIGENWFMGLMGGVPA
ncbi:MULTISPECIES: AAA family ATPase [unclassified Arcicella]|uniref:AAA family ATPase n=1 Tax=unclassified Arcicella TaxID=2644986 RepID=UPI002865D0A4|nr:MULTISPECIES: AAA family ATPase [unclassified Arcicella]MDR6561066.1 putative ATPase [Arcicella sp. BE51]MDR6810950.1 putative ATPase [Arcicella sp. BE140]MDR6822300.1 putative ATPase [Arcicella sp. BE139]